MNSLHNKMERQTLTSDTVINHRLSAVQPNNTALAQKTEAFLYGFLAGMSYAEQTTCYVGLQNTIYNTYQCIEYSAVYIPANTMNFALASSSLTDAVNSVYA